MDRAALWQALRTAPGGWGISGPCLPSITQSLMSPVLCSGPSPPAQCCEVTGWRSGCGHCMAVAVVSAVCAFPPPRQWRGHGWHCSLTPYLPGPHQPLAQNSSAAPQSAWSDSPAPPRPRYCRAGWGARLNSPPLEDRPPPGVGRYGGLAVSFPWPGSLYDKDVEHSMAHLSALVVSAPWEGLGDSGIGLTLCWGWL